MNEKIITRITDLLARKSKSEYIPGSDDYEILRYGLAVLYYTITKTILFLIAAIALNVLLYVLVFMAVFGGLRGFAKGLHLKSNLGCTILGFANYIVGIFLALNLNIGELIIFSIFGVCFLLNAIYAPSLTENSPISENQRTTLKIRTLIALTCLYMIMLVISDSVLRNIILIATVIETLHIIPITYKVFRERRG